MNWVTEGRTRRLATAALGLVLLSPLNLALFEVLPQGNALPLGVVFLMDALGIMLAIHGLPRAGTAVVLACVINIPLLWWVGAPEAGEWASLFSIPKYGIFLLAGWWSWSRRSDQGTLLRWVGALVPSACCTYIFVLWLIVG